MKRWWVRMTWQWHSLVRVQILPAKCSPQHKSELNKIKFLGQSPQSPPALYTLTEIARRLVQSLWPAQRRVTSHSSVVTLRDSNRIGLQRPLIAILSITMTNCNQKGGLIHQCETSPSVIESPTSSDGSLPWISVFVSAAAGYSDREDSGASPRAVSQ